MKDKILKVITFVMFLVAILGVSMLDSVNFIVPAALCGISFTWLGLFAYANMRD